MKQTDLRYMIGGSKMKKVKVCPKCKKEYSEESAISRRKDEEICSACGIIEAMEDMMQGVAYKWN